MSSTTSASVPQTTTCGTPAMYEIPVRDASCAVPNKDSYPDTLKSCANGAPVEPYDNDCALYALAHEQSVADLTKCLYDGGVAYQDVFCFGNTTATATSDVKETGSTSKETETPSTTGDAASPTNSDSAAILTEKPSRFALAVFSMVVCAMAAGAAA